MPKNKSHVLIVLIFVLAITCINGIIVAAAYPGLLIDKSKYIKTTGGTIQLSDTLKTVVFTSIATGLVTLAGFILFDSKISHMKSSHGDDNDDSEE